MRDGRSGLQGAVPAKRVTWRAHASRRRATQLAAALGLTLALPSAAFQTWQIERVYSNADGRVQFIVLQESAGFPNQHQLSGRTLTSTQGTVVKAFTFPGDLPDSRTMNRRLLVGTQGFAALNLIAPDYVIPDGFVPTGGATLDYGGVDQVTLVSLPTDGANAVTRAGASVPNLARNYAGAAAVIPALPVTSVEYYHLGLDHYFISSLQPEIDVLDSGRIAGWARTGDSFRVFAGAQSGLGWVNPVCRFYIPPAHGNSHFFSASPAECATVLQRSATDPNFSGYVYEAPNAFYIGLPDTSSGSCPAGTVPVYRLWNQRADSNHRYTASAAIKATMLTRNYVAEGYGTDAVIMCAPAPGTATLQFLATAGAPDGALVSDALSTAVANFGGYSTATTSVNVGPRSGGGEVIAFGTARAVALQPVTWTTAGGNQTVPVQLAPALAAPLTIWVVAGPAATTNQTALTLYQTAQQIAVAERFGIDLSSVEFRDATGNASAAAWGAFTCGAGNANVAALQAALGVRPGRINVYLVGLVDGSTSRGNACSLGGGFVAIAAGSSAELLAHELGHAFALEHIDDLVTDFDEDNVMHSASVSRQSLTEGQTFRAHLRPNSAVNAVYNARPGLPTRACDRDTLTLQCPAIGKRIWADGPYSAN